MAQLELPRELLSHPFSPAACGWDWECVKRGNEDVYSNWFLSSSSNDPWICPITLFCSASQKWSTTWEYESMSIRTSEGAEKFKKRRTMWWKCSLQLFNTLPSDLYFPRPSRTRSATGLTGWNGTNGLVPSCASARDEVKSFLWHLTKVTHRGRFNGGVGTSISSCPGFCFLFCGSYCAMRSPACRNKYLSRACPCARTQWSFLQWKVAQAATQGSSWIPHRSSLEAGGSLDEM